MEINKTIRTKVDKKGVQVSTLLTLIINLSQEQILEWAIKGMVIAWQSKARRAFKKGIPFPTSETWTVPEVGTRESDPIAALLAMARKKGMSEAKITALEKALREAVEAEDEDEDLVEA